MHRGHAIVGQTLLNSQRGVGRYAGKSPIMKWANMLSLQNKNSLKWNTASHNNAIWYTDTDGFLEHSSSGEACTTRACPPTDNLLHFFEGGPLSCNAIMATCPNHVVHLSIIHFVLE